MSDVPQIPGNGRFDMYENMASSFYGAVDTLSNLFPSSLGVNLLNTGLSDLNDMMMTNWKMKKQKEQYYDLYSPQARMRDMQEAGINPYTAAAGIAGSGGSSGGAGIPNGSQDFTESISTTAANMAAAEQAQANAANLEKDTEYLDKTMTDRVNMQHSLAASAQANSFMDQYRAQHYPEFYDKTVQELDSRIALNKAMKDMYNAQDLVFLKQLDVLEQEKRELMSRVVLNSSEIELNTVRKAILDKELEIARVNADRAKLSFERYKRSDEATPFQKMYDEILETQGEEAAEEWKNTEFKLAQDWNESQARGTSKGSDPQLASLWAAYETINSEQDYLDALSLLKRDADLVVSAAAGDPNVSAEEYLEKQKAADDLQDQINAHKVILEEAKKAFQKGNEFRGYRDPNKFYKDDWIKIGTEITRDLIILYGASKVGGSMPVKNSNPVEVMSPQQAGQWIQSTTGVLR